MVIKTLWRHYASQKIKNDERIKKKSISSAFIEVSVFLPYIIPSFSLIFPNFVINSFFMELPKCIIN